MRVLLSTCLLLLSSVSVWACERVEELSAASAQGFQASRPVSDAAADSAFDARAAQEILRLINQARTQAGAAPLAFDQALNQAAQAHGQSMLQAGTLSHRLPGEADLQVRLGQTGLRFNRAGENIAYDFSAQHAHLTLMQSDEHRQNILSRSYNTVGIAVAWVACQMYVVEDFAQSLPTYEAGQAEDLVAAKIAALRSQKSLPQLNRVKGGNNSATCSTDQSLAQPLQARTVPALTNARYVLSYSNSEPQILPSSAGNVINDGQMRDFSVGACFTRTEKHPNGAYFVTMMFY